MISIIVPFYNESKNIPILVGEIKKVMDQLGKEYEVLLVDDGSIDISEARIKYEEFKIKYKTEIHLVKHKRRRGKGEALKTGVEQARGEILLFMDGDLQDDPKDIPHFIDQIELGHDLVNGFRQKRSESGVVKMYSKVVNFIMNRMLHSPFHDMNCGFKALKKDVLKEIPLYGNNFRFLPFAVYLKGFTVTEIPVYNRKRIHGASKYGVGKLFIGLLDTVSNYFLFQFAEKPMHFFGSVGGFIFGIGFIISLILSFERIFFGELLYRRPLLQFGILLIIVGIQVAMTGILGELIVFINKRSEIKKRG